MFDEHFAQTEIIDRELERLRWRSRRGLLELDIFFSRFWRQAPSVITETDKATLRKLLEFTDNDILDLLMARKVSSDENVQKFIEHIKSL